MGRVATGVAVADRGDLLGEGVGAVGEHHHGLDRVEQRRPAPSGELRQQLLAALRGQRAKRAAGTREGQGLEADQGGCQARPRDRRHAADHPSRDAGSALRVGSPGLRWQQRRDEIPQG